MGETRYDAHTSFDRGIGKPHDFITTMLIVIAILHDTKNIWRIGECS